MYYSSYHIEKNEMGIARGKHERDNRCTRGFVGKPEEKGTLRILGVNARIILTLILKK
jgi:hypothetical protein